VKFTKTINGKTETMLAQNEIQAAAFVKSGWTLVEAADKPKSDKAKADKPKSDGDVNDSGD